MRRLTAAIALLAFANLVFVQGSGACPLSGGSTHGSDVAASPAEHSGHEGHALTSAPVEEALGQAPSPDTPHPPSCLTMGPCALTLDLSGVVVATATVGASQGVVARSDRLPPSLTTSPELPPPRA